MSDMADAWEIKGGQVVKNLQLDMGFTAEQAAGFVGNLGAETEGFIKLQEIKPMIAGSRGGYGWAQWTGPRRRAFENWCIKHNLKPSSSEANYGFVLEELRGKFKNFATKLRRTKTLAEACELTHKEYETPADVLDGSMRSYPKRFRYAQRALKGALSIKLAPPADIELTIAAFEEVSRTLQELLTRENFYHRAIDGDFGPQSRAALLAYKALYHPE